MSGPRPSCHSMTAPDGCSSCTTTCWPGPRISILPFSPAATRLPGCPSAARQSSATRDELARRRMSAPVEGGHGPTHDPEGELVIIDIEIDATEATQQQPV